MKITTTTDQPMAGVSSILAGAVSDSSTLIISFISEMNGKTDNGVSTRVRVKAGKWQIDADMHIIVRAPTYVTEPAPVDNFESERHVDKRTDVVGVVSWLSQYSPPTRWSRGTRAF